MNIEKLAAIDIGSNSIKLAVVEASASDSFTIVAREKETVRLGQETLRNKMLAPEAIERAAVAIGRLKSIGETRGARKTLAVATASVREAENAADFVRLVEEKTDVHVEVISPIEEARLIGIAASRQAGANIESLLNIDIGGGSTELSLMKNGKPAHLISVKLGAVGLSERFLAHDPPKSREIEECRRHIKAALDRPKRELSSLKWQKVSGTSGTIIALGEVIHRKASPPPKTLAFELEKLAALNKSLSKMNKVMRIANLTLSPQRAEVITAGGLILEGVMSALGLKNITPTDFALREGVVIDYLQKLEAESLPPVPDLKDERLGGVFAVGRRFGFEENHSLHVAFLAERIFDQIAPMFNLPRSHRTLLSAAALLHDIGYHISHAEHHKHTLYLIKHSEMTGFTEAERNLIGNIARYHRGALPREKHTEFMALSQREQRIVWQLGAILRIAEALDRGYENRVRDIIAKRKNGKIIFSVVSPNDCTEELEAVNSGKNEMFISAFGQKPWFECAK